MKTSLLSDLTTCETLMITLCRQERPRNLRQQNLRLETWQPNSARKKNIRQFITLWLDEEPLYIAKIPLSLEDSKVEREFAIIQQLMGLGVQVPEPLCAVGRGFVMRFLMTHNLPEVLSASAGDGKWLALVEQVVDRMIAFHSKFLLPAGETQPELIARDYVGDWQVTDEVTRRALASTQVGTAHGDLGPWNIRYDKATGKVGFIDWEDFRERGLPALDLLNFLFTLPLIIYPDARAIGFERLYELAFYQDGLFARLAATGLTRYAKAMSVQPRDLVALLPVYCQAMVERFHREGRSTNNLFYLPFQRLFSLEKIVWLPRLGQ